MAMTWREWVTRTSGGTVWFLLNKLAQPDPVAQFYAADWVEDAYPLYAGTPLSHLREQGPWLIKVKWQNLGSLAKTLDTGPFSGPGWGWAYHSAGAYDDQIMHWQRQHLVIFQGEERIFRLFDNRIAGALIPAFTFTDWSYLLMPVSDCLIPSLAENNYVCRPPEAEKKINLYPHKLGEHLAVAWKNSVQFRVNTVDNFYIQFWETHTDLAVTLEDPEGKLVRLINQCMDYYQADLVDIEYLTNDLFIRYLKQNNLIGNGQDAEYAI